MFRTALSILAVCLPGRRLGSGLGGDRQDGRFGRAGGDGTEEAPAAQPRPALAAASRFLHVFTF